jgi:small subunit ribosomal protein S16
VLVIRLTRIGARKKPRYRVVVMEKERARDGRPVETVGYYNPMTKPSTIELKRERVDYWVSKGAQPSDTVRGLLKFSETAAPAPTPAAA